MSGATVDVVVVVQVDAQKLAVDLFRVDTVEIVVTVDGGDIPLRIYGGPKRAVGVVVEVCLVAFGVGGAKEAVWAVGIASAVVEKLS